MSAILQQSESAFRQAVNAPQVPKRNIIKLSKYNKAPAKAVFQKEAAPKNQTMEPLWSKKEVNRVIAYCLEKGRIRDALLFVMGFNSGLRISDLILVQVEDVIANDKIVKSFRVKERKTSSTKNKKPVTVYINQALNEMLTLYFEHNPDLQPEDYLFRNQSYFKSPEAKKEGWYISRKTGWKIVKDTIAAVGIDGNYGSHTLRKTPALQMMVMEPSPEDDIIKNPNGLQSVQMFLNHKSVDSTLHYVGIKERQHMLNTLRLNLGLEAIQDYRKNIASKQ